jgi:hypothetical protein
MTIFIENYFTKEIFMKASFKLLGIIAHTAAIVFLMTALSMTGCDNATNPETKPTTGNISGKAYFMNAGSHAGITVTLEQTDGLRSLAAISAVRNAALGVISPGEEYSINTARSVTAHTQTTADGSYSFTKVAPGIYTVYASSPDSLEKAVAVNNVTLAAGKSVTAADLNLTPVGSIAGRVSLDGGEAGNHGFLVCVAGTSYMAVTSDDGTFAISGIPAGSNYLILIMKGNYTAVWTTTPQTVTGGQVTSLISKTITSAEVGGTGIVWKGESAAAPFSPQANWAYYNTETKTSYIWSGSKWDVLAAQGGQGDKGDKGDKGDNGDLADGVDHIAITGPTVTGYFRNASFSTNGLEVTAYYTDSSVAAITSGYSILWEGQVISAGNTAVTADVGTKLITVFWKGYLASYTITVGESDNIVVTTTDQWNNAMSRISSGGNDKGYTITVNGDIAVPGSTSNSFGSVYGLTVTLTGSGRLYLNSQGSMLRLASYQTLYIDGAGLTLEGLSFGQNGSYQDNNSPVVYMYGTYSTLELRNGTITNNNSTTPGGGVYVYNGGSFTMSGGTISGNTSAPDGGGVYVDRNSSFTMSGGVISGNTSGSGGGANVCLISSFTMSGGTISGNTGGTAGGGVHVNNGSSFTMNGGTISGNTGGSYGGNGCGVYVIIGGSFTMSDGTISGNTGGGVFVYGSSFSKLGGGIIYGNDANDANKNTAIRGDTFGHAVFYEVSSREFYRDTTLNAADDISTEGALPLNPGETVNGWTMRGE